MAVLSWKPHFCYHFLCNLNASWYIPAIKLASNIKPNLNVSPKCFPKCVLLPEWQWPSWSSLAHQSCLVCWDHLTALEYLFPFHMASTWKKFSTVTKTQKNLRHGNYVFSSLTWRSGIWKTENVVHIGTANTTSNWKAGTHILEIFLSDYY